MVDKTDESKFEEVPSQIIRKQRIQDVNIYKGKGTNIIDTDLRITVNHEHILKERATGYVASERMKERDSF